MVTLGRTYCCRPFRLAMPRRFHHGSVSTSRSSNRTGRFPASGSRTRLHAFACNAICSFRTFIGVDRFPNSRSFTTYCVCLELRSLPSTGVNRLPRYYEPLRHPSFRLVIADHALGLPVFVRFPCVHAAATTPAQRLNVSLRSFHPDVSIFPDRVVGTTCALSFSRIARRSLALRPAHSRCSRICRIV